MKRWLVFFCLFFIVLSIITYFTFSPSKIKDDIDIYEDKNKSAEDEKEEFEIYDEILSSQIISMYRPEIDEVENIDFFDYLRGVVASEMPADYSYEALKAQAVVARTYFYDKQKQGHEKFADICSSSSHCQAYMTKDEIFKTWKLSKGWSDEEINYYWQKINSAVVSTDGIIITYDGDVIKAFFHASSPVKTENADQIWGKISFPYLISVESTEDENYKNRYSEVEIGFDYFEDKIKQELMPSFSIGDASVEISSYTTGNRVNDIAVNNYYISAENLRKLFGLKSTLFTVERLENSFLFKVTGYGHGVGMSQVGADYLGKEGKTYEDIIKHYYTGVELKKI